MLKLAKARKAYETYEKCGKNKTLAAKTLGISRTSFRRYLDFYFVQEETDPAVISAANDLGITDLSIIQGGWLKNKEASFRFKMPVEEADLLNTVDALKEGLSDVVPATYIEPPKKSKEIEQLCAVFPVADLHIGLMTVEEEVGEDWDSQKAGVIFQETFGRLVAVTPASGTAILAQLGDLTHNDDQSNVTRQSGHQLDVDSRYFVILRRAVAVMKWAIDALRKKYRKVIYRGCRGNHDIISHYAVTLALAEHYRNTDSVEIVDNASEFYVYEFGSCMLALHHGDKAKPERLVTFIANKWAEMWGRTKYRLVLSGHIHHDTKKNIGGMVFESVSTIIPPDAYAFQHGYSADRGLVSITLDKKQGEINRARIGVKPK